METCYGSALQINRSCACRQAHHVYGIMTTTVDKFTAGDTASSLFFLSFYILTQMERHQGLYQVGDKVVYKEKKNSKNPT